VGEDWSELQELGILLDKDDDGYLLQIFTAPASSLTQGYITGRFG